MNIFKIFLELFKKSFNKNNTTESKPEPKPEPKQELVIKKPDEKTVVLKDEPKISSKPELEPKTIIKKTELLTKEGLKQLKVSVTNIEKYFDYLNESFKKYEINTPLRISHFISQVGHESGMFKYAEELASGEAYENRADLGNLQPGDGKKFKGRGFIQITGRNNYKKYSDYVGFDFIQNPTDLAKPKYAVDSACWYWVNKIVLGKNLNQFADEDFAVLITYLINGGYNGNSERLGLLKKCYKLFNVDQPETRMESHIAYIKNNLKIPTKDRKPSQKSLLKYYPDLSSIKKLEDEIAVY